MRRDQDRGTLALDEFGRTILDTTFDASQSRYVTNELGYDVESRLIFESYPQELDGTQAHLDPGKIGREYEYDGLGRISKVTQSARGSKKNIVRYTYGNSSHGNLTITQTDDRGSKTTTEYVSYGSPNYDWPISVKEADGTYSIIRRNSIGNVLDHTRSGVTTEYRYNEQNLVKSITRPGDSTTTLTYYDDGSLKRRANGQLSVVYHYHLDLQRKQEDHIDLGGSYVIREFLYDRNGNVAKTITKSDDGDQDNQVTYLYDEEDNVLMESLQIDGKRLDMKYEYDGRSNRKSVIFPNGNRYVFEPNIYGNPTSIQQVGGDQKTIYELLQYHPDQTAKLMRRMGHQVEMSIDSGMRPHVFSVQQYGAGKSQRFSTKEYSYDGANNVVRINDQVNQRYSTFNYDNRNRLTAANISNADNWVFSYLPTDDINWIQQGSRKSKYVYEDATRRFVRLEQGGTSRNFNYDRHGNMVKHERLTDSGSVVGMNLEFNAANQLMSTSDGTRYAYDARGLRVKKDLGGAIYSFYDSMKKLVYRSDTGAGVTSEYFYVNGKLVARRDEDVSGGSTPVSNPISTSGNPSGSIAPASPSTLWPAGNGISHNPEYKWSAESGVTDYFIEIRKADSDAVVVYKQINASDAGCSDQNGECTMYLSESPEFGANRWRVRSSNTIGASSWSNWRAFDVN